MKYSVEESKFVESGSPSMRREWIEMLKAVNASSLLLSPSMRREWIEMILSQAAEKNPLSLPPCGGSGLK